MGHFIYETHGSAICLIMQHSCVYNLFDSSRMNNIAWKFSVRFVLYLANCFTSVCTLEINSCMFTAA